MRPRIEEELNRLEKEGIITKVPHSDWGTPIVAVTKPNGQIRLCGDFKVTVNPALKIDQYPFRRVEELFEILAGGQKFTKLDLKNAYLQLEVDEDCKHLLTLNTHRGLYRVNRMVYGIASAPAIWQRVLEQILQGLPKVY
uniref:uncharacterized protein K02A2.6-like n=1 Tax=Styela clava TaxID=7725 RepID=UPI00193A8627|nr:uncharacterized protein K02A2.6-like [Styela clava]